MGGGAEENLVEDSALRYTAFDLRNDKHLNIAHKILNRDFLHHEYKQDPNALNPRFYKELLHILGLKEFDRGGKITIELDDTQSVSFAKHIASKLESHNEPSDFEAVMSHILLWLNRILFLKLIEANLLAFNGFDKSLNFLSSAKITSFKHLSHLFFEVLARDYEARGNDKGFNFLPYLNSSLFIKDERLETLDIALLDDALEITIFQSTQSTHKAGSKCAFLTYLFDFLNAFDFGKKREDSKAPCHSEALAEESQNVESSAESHDIESSDSKDLIRSSVLGTVFEKLNGYKEGSFYTPSFITSYMCKESLAKIVVAKFNAAFAWSAQSIEDLRKHIDRDFGRVESQAKQILSSMRICDPAVGSGHFLVSALNEMIFIYHKLGLLGFGYQDLQIKDDEIHLITKEGETFAYKRLQDSNHTIQIALFTLKKSIIENNLFGVDINPNSCNIARLRLWIELLKNAYYLNFTKDKDSKIHKLQTLPNIDINIKCGNSLISNIDTNITLDNFTHKLESRLTKAIEKRDLFLHQSLMSQIQDTKKKAQSKFQEMSQNARKYKNEHDKQSAQIHKMGYEEAYHFLCALFKRNCDEYINFHQALKEFFYQYGYINLAQLEPETRFHIESYAESFDFHKSVNFERSAQREIPQKELENILKLMRIYEEFQNQATFEWRFAFPEVLDSNGDFKGFDLVIGNPPYIRQQAITSLKPQLKNYKCFDGAADIYVYFFELAFKLLAQNARFTFVTSNKWVKAGYGKPLQKFLLEKSFIESYIDFSGVKVFDSASVDVSIIEVANYQYKQEIKCCEISQELMDSFKNNIETIISSKYFLKPQSNLNLDYFRFEMQDNTTNLVSKLKSFPLKFSSIAQIAKGSSTGNDKVFLFDFIADNKNTIQVKNEFGRFHIEKEVLVPFCYGEDIKRFEYCKATKYLLYPYDKENILINKNTLQSNYPLAYKYLENLKSVLLQRKIVIDEQNYYKFSALRNVHTYKAAKIMIPDLLNYPRFGFDNVGIFHNASIHNVALKENYKQIEKLILGVLNSKLFWFFIEKSSTKLGGSAIRLMPIYIDCFSFPKITKANQNIANQIIALVDEILKLKAKDSTFDTAALESRIDSLVYELYNLTQAEIRIIES